MDRFVLGVDGGGTKTVASVARMDDGRPVELGRGHAQGSNPVAVPAAAAAAELERAVRQACDRAGCRPEQMDGVCLAMAGSDRLTVRQQLERWASDLGLRGVRIVHDAEPVLAAGTPDGCGIALLSGTGSLAFGRNRQGLGARVGGWGPLLGDEGSAYRLVVSALQAVVRQLDGRGPTTELTRRLLDVLQVNQPLEPIREPLTLAPLPLGRGEGTEFSDRHLELPRQVASWDRARLAGLASVVMQLAATQDAVAEALVARRTDELAGMVACVMRRLEWQDSEFPLALSGGLLLNHPQFVSLLHQSLLRQQATPACVQLVHDPVQGALLMACR